MASAHLSIENVLFVCKLTTNHAILEFSEPITKWLCTRGTSCCSIVMIMHGTLSIFYAVKLMATYLPWVRRPVAHAAERVYRASLIWSDTRTTQAPLTGVDDPSNGSALETCIHVIPHQLSFHNKNNRNQIKELKGNGPVRLAGKRLMLICCERKTLLFRWNGTADKFKRTGP